MKPYFDRILIGCVWLIATCSIPLHAEELTESLEYESSSALFDFDPVDELLDEVGYYDMKDWLATEANLEIALGYTMVWQYASEVEQDSRQLFAGSYDIELIWSPVDDEDWGTGQLGVIVEGGQILSHRRDLDLTENIGAVGGVNDNLDTEQIVLAELWWEQRFADDTVVLVLGKIDASVYLAGNSAADDGSTLFLSTVLSTKSSVPFPDNGLGANLTVTPNEDWYVSFGISDAAAVTTQSPFSTLDEDKAFIGGEIAFTPTFDEYEGIYRFMFWGVEGEGNAEDGSGIAVSFEQQLPNQIRAFVRAGYADKDVSDFEYTASAGVNIESPFGRVDDLIGLGVGWVHPADDTLNDETTIEAFYRVQVLETLAITPDLQFIINPGESDNDVVVVSGIRARWEF